MYIAPPDRPLRAGDWVVAANMCARTRNGKDQDKKYTGTRMFSPGRRLYLGQGYWGMGQSMHVIGLRRISRDLVNCVVNIELIKTARPALIYSKTLIQKLEQLGCMFFLDRSSALEYVAFVNMHRGHDIENKQDISSDLPHDEAKQ
jgi:hypothetical protein